MERESPIDFSKVPDDVLMELFADIDECGLNECKIPKEMTKLRRYIENIHDTSPEWQGDPFGHLTMLCLKGSIFRDIPRELALRYIKRVKEDKERYKQKKEDEEMDGCH